MAESSSMIDVIGAGVVGMSTALYLRRSGHNVTVVDPFPAPGGASYGNAGMLSADTVVPIALPGMLPKVPSWLLDPLGPLSVRPAYFPKAMPWLMKWIAAGRWPNVEKISDSLREIHKDSFNCWKELLGSASYADLIRNNGQVHLWESEQETESAALERKLRERHGIKAEAIGADEIRQMFPGITRDIKRGVLVPGNGYTVNPQRLVETLGQLFSEAGGKTLAQQVFKIIPETGGYRLLTNTGFHRASTVVVAAGAFSRRLVEPLGINVPLETERGYHAMLPNHGLRLSTTISNKTRSFGMTPMEHGLRVAGTVEIAGLDTPPNEKRAEALLTNVKRMFPDVKTEGHTFWMGMRPSTPDSLPIAGEAPGHPGLYLAFGHGHFGMTGGPPTGRLIARLISKQKPELDPARYSLRRFN